MYKFTFPFEPPWEDLKISYTSHGAKCYIFDTCCKNFTAEDKARTDAEIIRIYTESARKKALAAQEA